MSTVENAYPLSELQKGMVFYTEKEDGLYHDVFIYSFSGKYDFNLIKKAFQMLMDENPVLRTSFRIGDLSEPIQLVHKKVAVSITEFINFEDQLLENDINDYVSDRQHLSFEWELPPLWQVGVFKNQNNDKFSICLDFHHSILDGWSVATLMQTFCEYYFKELGGEASNILIDKGSAKGTYADFIKLERSASDDETHQKFWKNEVEDSNLVSPYGVSQSKNINIKIYDQSKNLNSDDTASLYQLSNQLKVPLKNICLSVHLKVLSMLSNEKKITTGIVANGRPEIGGESILGLFLNTLPFTVEIPDSKNWSDFILSNFEKEKNFYHIGAIPFLKC
ncbi:Linear gramicidin synthase subunit D [Streptococcus intermedius]|uniref:Linear gramicidin synthase subunit D n=1 Tax=Streptococcus intermedius TaxID=1338 RepID=A0AAE8KBY4_STRIT|nr:condensation domain-containing protein [Streptococcus intermedius]RSJ23715.1 Linear gramicidin synthase subunit D [Streptococcus intermedius]